MKGKVIIPPDYETYSGKLIFLAGPIQGAQRWQDEAIKEIQENAPEMNIANPRRDYLNEKFVFDKQVDWETIYLNEAAKNGVILFWLAKEFEHACTRAYAQTTRFELAK